MQFVSDQRPSDQRSSGPCFARTVGRMAGWQVCGQSQPVWELFCEKYSEISAVDHWKPVHLQLLMLLERDSSFDVVQNPMQGYRLPVEARDYITNTIRPLWKTGYIQYMKEVEIKSVLRMCELRKDHWLHWLTYKKLISLYLGFWLLVWYGI